MGADLLESVSEKRAQKFSSWGGKRNNEEDESETEADIKRAQKFRYIYINTATHWMQHPMVATYPLM